MTLSAVTTSVDLLHPSTFVFFLVPLIYSSKIRHVVDNQQFIRTRPSSPLRANCKSSNQHGRNHSNQRRMLLSLLDRASQPWAQRMVTLQGSRKPKTLPSTTFFKFPLASANTEKIPTSPTATSLATYSLAVLRLLNTVLPVSVGTLRGWRERIGVVLRSTVSVRLGI
jgi:hypothetical protein